jgi:hypothetical protein
MPVLKHALEVAGKLEVAASQKTLPGPLQVAGYGFLVRNRRLAAAIARLGRASAYESRLLLRAMLEIQINYAWIRLRNRYSRALRYHRFWPIERLRLLEKASTIFKEADYGQKKQQVEAERRKVRQLFRFRDTKGKMRWAESWAKVNSIEARLVEVLRYEKPTGQPDPFMYGLYVSFSSAVHGSPNSLQEVLRVTNGRLVAAEQPESDPDRHLVGAFILLASTIEAFAEDARLRRALRADIRIVSSALEQLREKGKGYGINRPSIPCLPRSYKDFTHCPNRQPA